MTDRRRKSNPRKKTEPLMPPSWRLSPFGVDNVGTLGSPFVPHSALVGFLCQSCPSKTKTRSRGLPTAQTRTVLTAKNCEISRKNCERPVKQSTAESLPLKRESDPREPWTSTNRLGIIPNKTRKRVGLPQCIPVRGLDMPELADVLCITRRVERPSITAGSWNHSRNGRFCRSSGMIGKSYSATGMHGLDLARTPQRASGVRRFPCSLLLFAQKATALVNKQEGWCGQRALSKKNGPESCEARSHIRQTCIAALDA